MKDTVNPCHSDHRYYLGKSFGLWKILIVGMGKCCQVLIPHEVEKIKYLHYIGCPCHEGGIVANRSCNGQSSCEHYYSDLVYTLTEAFPDFLCQTAWLSSLSSRVKKEFMNIYEFKRKVTE